MISKKPVSVIFATRDKARYIGRTLRLVRKVAEKCGLKVELIVVDSSDDDHTLSVASKFADKAFRFRQRGVSKARNFGASRAEGDILVFMDADSIPETCIFKSLAKIFQNSEVCAAVSYVYSYDSNLTLSQKIFYVFDVAFVRSCKLVPFLLKFYNRSDFLAVRRDAFFKAGAFNEQMNVMEINDLLLRIQRMGKVAIIDKPVYESSRRLKKWGFLKSHLYWWINYLTYYMLGRMASKSYPAIR